MPSLPTLIQFPVSHYCEKARWALEWAQLPYQVHNLVPLLHVPVCLRLSGQTQVPILQMPGQLLCGSEVILDALGESFAPLAADESSQHWGRWADREIGPHVRRLLYFHLLKERRWVEQCFVLGQGALMRRAVHAAFPAIRAVMRRGMRIDARGAELSARRLAGAVAELQRTLERQPYLSGPQFGRADLSVAALLAPLYAPPQYPLPWPAEWPLALQQALRPFEPLRDWVMQVYADHRSQRD